jgi:Fe-S oxidoreductase
VKTLRGKVVLLVDCFTEFHEPRIGRAAIELLETAGYQVHLADLCCGRTLISKGFLREAKTLVETGLRRFARYLDEGMPILGLEPSCYVTLADEWPDLAPGDDAKRVAELVRPTESFLADADHDLRASEPFAGAEAAPKPPLYHGHCHQKSALKFDESVRALNRLSGSQVEPIDSGCCGMAGSFGYEVGKYEMSERIASMRLLPAVNADVERTVLAPGFSCRCQLRDLSAVKPIHPIQYLHQRLMPSKK